jgi:septal ring factor EnvC (AmiA/AmiB activator)
MYTQRQTQQQNQRNNGVVQWVSSSSHQQQMNVVPPPPLDLNELIVHTVQRTLTCGVRCQHIVDPTDQTLCDLKHSNSTLQGQHTELNQQQSELRQQMSELRQQMSELRQQLSEQKQQCCVYYMQWEATKTQLEMIINANQLIKTCMYT